MGKKIGIDLGTTYSCVYYIDDAGILRVIDASEGGNTTPSVVFFDPNGEVVVGATARVSCLVLQKRIKDAEEALGEDIDGAIITCPAYFGDAARNATIKAGENVTLNNGQRLKVLGILDEPVAAALAYGNSLQEDMKKKILIYDLGGGTFDCTVMDIDYSNDKKKMEVITTDGHHQLGGKDWDAALADYVRNEFCSRTDCDPEDMKNDPECVQWFSENIERAKQALTNKTATNLVVNFNGCKEKIEITRDIFENETQELLDRTISKVDEMLANKGMNMMNDIDEIIMVGGSTKMPQVRRRLEQEYNKPVNSYEPDKAVAMGAALVASGTKVEGGEGGQGSQTSDSFGEYALGGDSTIVVEDETGTVTEIIIKCTKSYGLSALRGNEEIIANIIMKDSEKPAMETRRFGTSAANQVSLNLEVYENDSLQPDATVEESTKLYESCIVELTPGLPKGAPIDITFNLDKNGVLVITALDVTNGISTVVTPVRIGGDADDIGMDEVVGVVLR